MHATSTKPKSIPWDEEHTRVRQCALEWKWYYKIIKEFCDASGMEINYEKSCFFSMSDELDPDINSLFPVQLQHFDEGLTYLGYRLKPNCYKVEDWLWLIQRIEHRIGSWCYRSLSLGGRLILIKSALESIPVYWMTMLKIPVSVLNHIRRLASSFLWSGNQAVEKIHLVKWPLLARPKSLGGWGLKDFVSFGRALRMKTMWRFLSTESLWSQICCVKYLRGADKLTWFIKGHRSWGSASPMWNAILETRPWILPGLTWLIGSGEKVDIQDLSNDLDIDYNLSPQLIAFFRIKGYVSLPHFCTYSPSLVDHWKGSAFFRLNGSWKEQWDRFTASLKRLGIMLSDRVDCLYWNYNPLGNITAKSAYQFLISDYELEETWWWDKNIWQVKAPLKIICFFWLLMNNRILTWDQLCKRGWIGPSICALCREESEDISHLFLRCPVTGLIWSFVCSELNIQMTWKLSSLPLCFDRWSFVHKRHYTLPLFICWGVWLLRNSIIFEGRPLHWMHTGLKILSFYKEFYKKEKQKDDRIFPSPVFAFDQIGFFDGAAAGGKGGSGFILFINKDHYYRGWTGITTCTNNLAELFAVWSLLFWASQLKLARLSVIGDSLIVINWLKGVSQFHTKNLVHHCYRVRELLSHFDHLHFQHISRRHNKEADTLSKKGIGCPEGVLQIEEFEGGQLKDHTLLRIII